MGAIGLAVAVPSCLNPPERDPIRNEMLVDRFRARQLPRHRLTPPIPAEADDPIPTAVPGPAPERFWVEQMGTGDPLTALTRHSDLVASGMRGFVACLAWLDTAAGRGGIATSAEAVGAVHVLRCLDQMMAGPLGETIAPELRAVTAARLAPFVAAERPDLVRFAGYRVLCRAYTENEAPILARGIAEADVGVRLLVSDALTVFSADLSGLRQDELVNLKEFVSAREAQRLHEIMVIGPTAASAAIDPSGNRVSAAISPRIAQMTVLTAPPTLRLVGVLDPTTEAALRHQSDTPAWHHATAQIGGRSRAAVKAAPVLWDFLAHPEADVRARAAQALRVLTGGFAGYRATAGPLARQQGMARWAAHLLPHLADVAPSHQ